MTITKSVHFKESINSTTINTSQSIIIGQNGVVTGGKVTTTGSVATIQPLTFFQNGLFVTSDTPLTATVPTGLIAPYSIAVTTPTTVQSSGEVITPIFVQRPEDVSSDTVIVSDWDGFEWVSRQQPLQISGIIQAERDRAIAANLVGVSSGFDVSNLSTAITVTSGSLVDQQGDVFTKTLSTVLTAANPDLDGLDRIDEIVFRRPNDDINRSGTIQLVTGRSFNAASTVQILHNTQFGDTAYLNTAGKVLNDPVSNSCYFLYIQDYGSRATLNLVTTADAMTSTTPAVSLTSDLTGFDAILTPFGIDIVYTRGNSIYYQRVSEAGAPVFLETLITTHTQAPIKPKMVSVANNSIFYLHIVYELPLDSLNHQIFYARMSSAGTLETPGLLLVSLSSVLTNPSLAKDDNDSMLYLAFENYATGRVYLRQYDASRVTSYSVPVQYGTSLELQDDTYIVSSATTAPVTGSSHPKVIRTANKETYVFWLQDKGSSVYGTAVYNKNIAAIYGHKAAILDLNTMGEDVLSYDVVIDGLNGAHYLASIGSDLIKSSYNLETYVAIGSPANIDVVAPSTQTLVFTSKGSLVHCWSDPNSGPLVDNSNQASVLFTGPGNYLATAIASNEFVVASTTGNPLSPGYDDLDRVPTLGDSVTLSSAGANNGTYTWASSRTFTSGSTNYTVVGTSGTFVSSAGGPLAQFKYQPGSNIFFAKSTAGIFTNWFGYAPLSTDVFLAHYRSLDETLYVANVGIGENQEVIRLYEFFSAFEVGGGNISWGVVGPNMFATSAPMYIKLFDRKGTYTINTLAGGVEIDVGQVAYVQIPDIDEDATIYFNVLDSGTGVLGRDRRNSYPLLWNVDGVLYTKFSPFRLLNGQTGTLDEPQSNVDSGHYAVTSGVTSMVVPFGTTRTSNVYSLVVSMTNTIDTNPMLQPIMVTAKSTTNFTVSWTVPLDTSNYLIEYHVRN